MQDPRHGAHTLISLAGSASKIKTGSMTRVFFLIPGDLSLPTGGYAYDRRVLALLGREGIDATHVELPCSFPAPSQADLAETARIVGALPTDSVLLIDGLAFGAMPPALIANFKRPVVALCHHPLALEAGLSPARASDLKASETSALASAREVIVTSSATRGILVRDFGVPAYRITVAVPGTDPAQRSNGGPGDRLTLLAVGSVVPRKGYDVLVRALAALPKNSWCLDIVGAVDRAPQTTDDLRDLIKNTELATRVRLLGAVSDERLQQLYLGADLFVMSSHFEGYGMVLAEAMSRGLPIVSTTGGAAVDTVPDAAALKVAPGDVEALTSALHDVMSDTDLRSRMGDASWRSGQSLPRWADTARTIATVLRKVTL